MDDPAAEIQPLQRCIRELVAFSTLPAIWAGQDARRIAESLAEVLHRAIPLEVICLAVREPSAGTPIHVTRVRDGASGGEVERLCEALVPWLDGGAAAPPGSIPDPCGRGSLLLARVAIGWDAGAGVLIAASRQPDFPSQTDRLLLSVAANHAALVLQDRQRDAERKRLEAALAERAEELETANRRKDEFLAMLGHELRNPLGAISNALEVLRETGSQDPQVAERRAIIARQTRHLTMLVDDLLDVSRITRGLIELDRRPVDLASVVAHAVETCRAVVDQRRHDLSVSLPLDPVWVDADATRLEQITANLLTNAARYTAPGGRIELSVAVESDELRVESPAGPESGLSTLNSSLSTAVITVRDNGAGIPAEMLPRIFDLFTQAHRDLDRSQGGLGIGLTLVRKLIELHGGAVEAHSAGAGQGSEFVVRLPALPATRMETPLPRSTAPLPVRPLRILVVDDHLDAAVTLADLLQLRGHQVQVVHTGPEAVEAVAARRPEVVLLDIGLPGLNGYEVARQLREHEAREPTPMLLVAVTGYGQQEDQRHAREAGFDHHLAKPIDFDALQQILLGLVAGTPQPTDAAP